MHRYLYLMKNMRCIFVPYGGESLNHAIKFIRKSYRNRCVGVPRWFLEGNAELIGKKPFVEINLSDELKEQLPSPDDSVLKTVILSCHYIVPIVSTREFIRTIKDREGTIINFSFSGQLDDRDKKFNIRLGDYAMTDFLIELVEETRNWFEKNPNGTSKIETLFSIRKEKIKSDFKKRFWRLSDTENHPPEEFFSVIYFDPLRDMLSQSYSYNTIANLTKKFSHLLNACVMLLL